MGLMSHEVDFPSKWAVILGTVRNIMDHKYISRSEWTDRFNDVYHLCIALPEPHTDRLYAETKDFLEIYVRDLCSRVRDQGKQESVGLLRSYHSAWKQYRDGIINLSKLYRYLNQMNIKRQQLAEAEINFGNIKPNPNEPIEIGELGLVMWKKWMLEPLREDIVRLLLENIKEDRMGTGNFTLAEILQEIIFSFVEVNRIVDYRGTRRTDYYEENFEKPFLEATGEFYQCEAAKLMQECSISEYLEVVRKRLREENKRICKFLHPTSFTKADAKCQQYFVADHLQALLSECELMVKEERLRDLQNIYTLLKPLQNGLPVLAEQFVDHVYVQGLNAISNLQGDNVHMQFVENILGVYTKYSAMVNEVFSGDSALASAMDRACAKVINHKPSGKLPCRSPELLAKYCDALLKKSSKGVCESEVEEKLTNSITIFRYIDDKDVYQKFYSKMLARRLIHQQSQSMDSEEAMINKLKQACGFEFTNKLHRMYTDISLSTDLNTKFQDHLKKNTNIELGINFQINVLQAGAWPLGPGPTTFIVPQEFVKSIQNFEDFYKQSFNGRRLTWYHHLCQGELKLSYLQKPYIVSMQTFQMAILLLFEKVNELTGQELLDGVGLTLEQLGKQVQTLVDAKLLLDNGAEFSPTAVISLNLEYTNKRTRFKIFGAQQRETPQEVQTTLASVEEDRKLVLQAAIVRIMKNRKVLKHNALLQELLAQKGTSFQPAVPMIKKCIEALIDKQYIERTPHSQDEYSYVA